MEGENILSILLKNFFTYDFIVFLLAGLNLFILLRTRKYAEKLFGILNPTGWLPGGDESLHSLRDKYARQKLREEELVYLRRKAASYYQLYENITSIFPLLGILGTVVSLLPMVSAIGEVATGYFFAALTSTLWGIVFAILFKAANGFLSARIEDNEKNVAVYLERNTNAMKAAAMSDAVRESVERAAYEADVEPYPDGEPRAASERSREDGNEARLNH